MTRRARNKYMNEKEYLSIVWKVAVDSVKNAAHGNQDIGALNECLMETRKRLHALGVSEEELKEIEK